MQPIYVDISNVAEWLAKTGWTKESWSLYPTLLSPWEVAIYRYKFPKSIVLDGVHYKTETRTAAQVTITVADLNDSGTPHLIGLEDSAQRAVDEKGRFLQIIEYLLEPDNRQFTGFMYLDESGAILGNGIYSHFDDAAIPVYFQPVAFSLSLLHCRNVEIRDRPVSRQQRRMAERTGKPAITYKELVIDAFRRQVRYETSQSGESEIKRALHICRGHFATYTDDNPLFGRYTGTFWRPMHVRGDKAAGEIRKTYKIKGEE